MHKFPMPKMYGAVTVGQRGQVVIPMKIRKLYGIKTGEKLIVFAKPGGPIGFIPAEHLSQFLDEATKVFSKAEEND